MTAQENLIKFADSMADNLDRSSRELKGVLDYMKRIEGMSVTETYIFHGILTTLAFMEAISLEDFAKYAKTIGNYDDATIEEWWNRPHHVFTTFSK